jgi:hypothetical protein
MEGHYLILVTTFIVQNLLLSYNHIAEPSQRRHQNMRIIRRWKKMSKKRTPSDQARRLLPANLPIRLLVQADTPALIAKKLSVDQALFESIHTHILVKSLFNAFTLVATANSAYRAI